MIEIKEKVEQVIYFPKNSNEVLEIYSLELHSELTQKSYTFSVVDSGNSNRYYKFTVDFSDVDDGEYNYSISGIDTGLIRIGEINKEYSVSSFDDDVEVIQYGSNVKPIYQHKEVNINEDGTYVITPDDGYDALSKVTAYVNIPQTGHTDEEMEEAYKSGYTEGWKDGYSSVVPDAVDYTKLPLTFNILSAGTINWTASDSSVTRTIEYKVNGGEWTSITSNTGETAPTINVVEGDKIQFRGNNIQYATSFSNYNSFGVSIASFEAEGNIMSLIYGDDFKNNLTISSESAFSNLFRDCVNLVSAENLVLPATTLVKNCYGVMFYGCTSLAKAPALPATTLAEGCYQQMFYRCTSLTTAPELPATTLAESCYSGMFRNCTSLTTAPSILPATTLASQCYSTMFAGCTSLTTAPALPATTLAKSCYQQMFYRCTSLTTAPALPATDLVISCYKHMFQDCASLTTAPVLPATTLAIQCYYGMFRGCSSLNYIKCLATDISASKCTLIWVTDVAETGTFIKKQGITWEEGINGIPNGWIVVEE